MTERQKDSTTPCVDPFLELGHFGPMRELHTAYTCIFGTSEQKGIEFPWTIEQREWLRAIFARQCAEILGENLDQFIPVLCKTYGFSKTDFGQQPILPTARRDGKFRYIVLTNEAE